MLFPLLFLCPALFHAMRDAAGFRHAYFRIPKREHEQMMRAVYGF